MRRAKSSTHRHIQKKVPKPPLTPIKEENSTNITLPEVPLTPALNSKHLESKLNKTNDESNENKFLAAAQEVLHSQKPSNLEATRSQKPSNKVAYTRDLYSKMERAKAVDYRQSKTQEAIRPLAQEKIHSQKPSNSIASSRVASERKRYGEENRKKARAYQLMKAQQNARPSK